MDRIVVAALTAVAFLLPFERIGGFAVGGFNLRLSQVALALAWFFFLGASLHRPGGLNWRRPSYLALAGFVAAAGLSLINADNPSRSLLVLAFTIFAASLCVILPVALRNERDLTRVRTAILISAALVSLLGLWQFVGDMLGAPLWMTGLRETYSRAILGFTRVQATAAEPLYFADYLLLPISLSAAWLLRGAGRFSRPLAALLAVMFIDVFLTSSRGGWLGLGVTVLVLCWLERRRLASQASLLRGGALVLVAIAASVLLLSQFFSPTRQTVAERFYEHVTTVFDGAAFADRAETFTGALDAWRRHPWIGVGFGGYGPFISPFPYAAPESGWPIVNNETLELLAETGAIGLAAFLIFLVTLFSAALRQKDSSEARSAVRTATVAALAGMLAQYQTFSTLYVVHVWFTIGLLLTVSADSD